MKNIDNKQYTNFHDFYNDAYKIVQNIKNETEGMLAQQRVEYMRQHIERYILNKYIDVCKVSDLVMQKLDSSSKILKFSLDNLIKNNITHSDISYEDYLKIPHIAKNPSKIIKSSNSYDVMLLKFETKYYKLVVKTTKNRKENFIKSFHLIRENRYNKY